MNTPSAKNEKAMRSPVQRAGGAWLLLFWPALIWVIIGLACAGAIAATQSDARTVGTRIATAGSCTAVSIGNDLTHANTTFFIPLGRAANQVFLARDTLVTQITVWKPALPETLTDPMQLFVTGTDVSFGDTVAGPNPNPLDLLFQGPFVVVPYTDGTHAMPVSFIFDPPLVLPSRGYYTLAVKQANCAGEIALLGDTLNAYTDGAVWKTVPNNDCSALGNNPRATRGGTADLIFQVEFCELGVPAVQETWGRLKARYR